MTVGMATSMYPHGYQHVPALALQEQILEQGVQGNVV